MYVNRKKRSVKWIHDDGREEERFIDGSFFYFDDSSIEMHLRWLTNFSFLEQVETKENGYDTSLQQQQQQLPYQQQQQNGAEVEHKKVPLKLLMDPRHVQDMNSMRNQYGYEAAPMSPEFGYELVNALNAPKGKGEIF